MVHVRAEQTTPGNILSMTASFMKKEDGLENQFTHREDSLRPEWKSPGEVSEWKEARLPRQQQQLSSFFSLNSTIYINEVHFNNRSYGTALTYRPAVNETTFPTRATN